MENTSVSLIDFAELAAEGCRRFGDDPKAITAFIEEELEKRPPEVRRSLQEQFSLWIDGGWH